MKSKDKGFQTIVMNGSWPKPDQLEMALDELCARRAAVMMGPGNKYATMVGTQLPFQFENQMYKSHENKKG